MKVLNEKFILKRATRHLIPDAVRRRSKQPYRAPDAKCFTDVNPSGRPPDYVEALLAPDRLGEDGLFNPRGVQHLLAKARSGHAIGMKDNMGLVGVLSTQLVVDRFIRNLG
jgi:asparagine synthase (glutamine-hydrolysing)